MLNKNKYFIGLLFALLFLSLNFFGVSYTNGEKSDNIFSQTAYAAGDTGGLVPCGHGSDVANRCTLCDLFKGIDRIIKWGRNILVAVALTALTAGGIMYIVSAGNQQMMEAAKNLIKQSLVGVAIVLGAWLIINTVIWLIVVKSDMGVGAGDWFNFNCNGSTSSSGGQVNSDVLNQEVNNAFNDNLDNGTGEQINCPEGQHAVTVLDVGGENSGEASFICVSD